MTRPTVRYGYVDTPLGQLHYAEAGESEFNVPIVLLHQTPRTHDEYRELLPLLGVNRRTIAMDMYGFGMSAKPEGPQSIEQYASGVLALVDALGVDKFVVLGHHTGFYAAMETAAQAPERVVAAVLSAGKYMDDEFRANSKPLTVDSSSQNADGSHLLELWAGRISLYPPNQPDLLDRYIRDALAPGVDPREGHRAVGRYLMDERAGLVLAPVLVMVPTLDPISIPHTEKLRIAFPNADRTDVVEIEGGRIPVMEEKAADVAEVVTDFLAEVNV